MTGLRVATFYELTGILPSGFLQAHSSIGKDLKWRYKDSARKQLQDAIDQLKADIAELETHIPNWISENTSGTKLYRPIAKQIVHSADRLDQIVRKNTYTP